MDEKEILCPSPSEANGKRCKSKANEEEIIIVNAF